MSPGGVRVGAPALTTRGMKEPEFRQIAVFMDRAAKLAIKIQQGSGKMLKDFVIAIEVRQFLFFALWCQIGVVRPGSRRVGVTSALRRLRLLFFMVGRIVGGFTAVGGTCSMFRSSPVYLHPGFWPAARTPVW